MRGRLRAAFMRSTTLRGKLLRGLLVPLSLLFLLAATGSWFLGARLAQRVYDGELLEIARELVLHVRRDAGTPSFDLGHDAERSLLLDQYDDVYFAVRTASGTLLGGDPALHANPDGAAGSPFFNAVLHGEPVRVVELQAPGGAPRVTVAVAETRVKREMLARQVFLGVVLPQLALILVAGLLVWIGVARGLAPLAQLRAAVAARSHRDLSPVAVGEIPGEVHPLVAALNELLARLSEVLSFQNRFIADAAHQLRTPVAGLKAHIEVALREEDPAQMRQSLAHLYTSVERLSRLVAQLLSLARNEPNTVKALDLVAVDLDRLACDVTMEWVPEAYKKHIDLGFEAAGARVLIRGDPVRLTELINNLLDNAIRYSHDGGRVTVRVRQGGTPTLSVSDDGPTIPATERTRVFERFHRLLGSHTDGSGLGLAIVREIATLHGATIALDEDSDGVGNRFSVAFPAAEPAVVAA
jgi:two-component system sensor histidine kinase TctE